MIKKGTIQPKLKINTPGDIYEQEADRVADQVMRMTDKETLQTKPSPINIQRKCKECEEEEKQLQRVLLAGRISDLNFAHFDILLFNQIIKNIHFA